jgi:uncharacterized protein with FMN-binding domain
MRRAQIVITATVVGLIAVLEFHTRPSAVGVGTIPAAGQAAATPAATAPPRSGSAGSGAPPRPGAASSSPASPGTASSGPARQAAGNRTATGPSVNYNWGVLSVTVTVSGTKIVKVGIGSLDDGGNPRSQFIDQQSIPLLEQQALQAQSANIQGVSGASYTSAGFTQSLQGALHQLGLQ